MIFKYFIVALYLQTEATEVFFSVTKLFQARDIGLRRMVYLIIKELSPSADEVSKNDLKFLIVYRNFLLLCLTC